MSICFFYSDTQNESYSEVTKTEDYDSEEEVLILFINDKKWSL